MAMTAKIIIEFMPRKVGAGVNGTTNIRWIYWGISCERGLV